MAKLFSFSLSWVLFFFYPIWKKSIEMYWVCKWVYHSQNHNAHSFPIWVIFEGIALNEGMGISILIRVKFLLFLNNDAKSLYESQIGKKWILWHQKPCIHSHTQIHFLAKRLKNILRIWNVLLKKKIIKEKLKPVTPQKSKFEYHLWI